jgi:hypothetical protein
MIWPFELRPFLIPLSVSFNHCIVQAVDFRLIPMADPFTRIPPVSPNALHLEEIPSEFRDEFTCLMQRIDFLEAESIREQVHAAREELRGPDHRRVPLH